MPDLVTDKVPDAQLIAALQSGNPGMLEAIFTLRITRTPDKYALER